MGNSFKVSLTERSGFEGSQLTERKLNASTPTISTPMNTAGEEWTSNQSATGVHFRKSATSVERESKVIREPNMYDGQTSWEAYYAQFCIIADMNGRGTQKKRSF